MDDYRTDHSDPKGPLKRNHPKQLYTQNVLIDAVANTNAQIREEIYYSLISGGLFS